MLGLCFGEPAPSKGREQVCVMFLVRQCTKAGMLLPPLAPKACYTVGSSPEPEPHIWNPLCHADKPFSSPVPGDGANGLNPAVLDALQAGPVFGGTTVTTNQRSIEDAPGENTLPCKNSDAPVNSPITSNHN